MRNLSFPAARVTSASHSALLMLSAGLDHVAVRLISLDLGQRQIRKTLAQQHFDRADCGNITLPEWSRQSRFGRVGRSRQF
jgi:hypothetical protein